MNEPRMHTIGPLRLSFRRPYRSLGTLPDVELPPLTVLTGVNGVGKTHLLQAIKEGAVTVEGIAPEAIVYFDWTSMYTLNSNTVKREHIRAERLQVRNAIGDIRRAEEGLLRSLLEKNGISVEYTDPWKTLRSNPSARKHSAVADLLTRANKNALNVARSLLSKDVFRRWVKRLGSDSDELVLLDERELELLPLTHPVGSDGFSVGDIGRVMMSYFELRTHNRLCALDEAEGRTPELPVLTPAGFEELYGPPPWEVLTEVMQALGLDFEIQGPNSYAASDYTPCAIKRSTGAPVALESLSSGEKMLMALALSTYSATTRSTPEAVNAKLVLLDEIDAPLHPSMSRVMLDVIQSTIQERLGCGVILATHAPATVVASPAESVYVMRPGQVGIYRQSRERALRVLTAGMPTLSLDFSGRRQVFVESQYDAQRYESLYRLYESHLNSELSLSFIGVGIESDEGSRGAGCQVVREMVHKLRDHGNQSVWGLVDWDCGSESTKYVKVLAPGRRYAIENLLLDPLLVTALVIDADHVGDCAKLGLERNCSISALLATNAHEERQRVIRVVERLVLGHDLPGSELLDILYFGGFTHQVSVAYLQRRGHDLVTQVFEVLPSLKRHRKERQLLERSIRLLKEHPQLLPRELVDTLHDLLQPDI